MAWSTAFRWYPMDSTLLYGEVRESGERLVAALAEERKAHALGADNPNDTALLGRRKVLRKEVLRAADHYSNALENYLEAVVSTLGRVSPAGPPWITSPPESRRPELVGDLTKNYRTSTVRRCRASVHRPPSLPAGSATVERCVTADISIIGGSLRAGQPMSRTPGQKSTRTTGCNALLTAPRG